MVNTRVLYYDGQVTGSVAWANLKINLQPYPVRSNRDSVVSISITDDEGRQLVAHGSFLHYNDQHQNWLYFNAEQGDTLLQADFAVPPSAHRVRVSVQTWHAEANSAPGLISCIENVALNYVDGPEATDFTEVNEGAGVPLDGCVVYLPVIPSSQYNLSWSINEPAGDALLLAEYFDEQGLALMPAEDLLVNPILGSYIYALKNEGGLSSPEKRLHLDKDLVAPERAGWLKLTGHHWKGEEAHLFGRPILAPAAQLGVYVGDSVRKWFESFQTDDNVVILYTTSGPVARNNTLTSRSNRIAIECAERGWKVVLVSSSAIRPVDQGFVPVEGVLQLPTEWLVDFINTLTLRRHCGKGVFFCSSRADMTTLGIQNRLQDFGWKTVYEIRDDMEELHRLGLASWYRPRLEARFVRAANGVIATSKRLADKISVIGQRRDVVRLPNAAPDVTIDSSRCMRTVSNFKNKRQRPIIGYLGHMSSAWFDWGSLLRVAREHPEWTFELIGPGMPSDMHLPHNVRALGAMNHGEVLEVVQHWRVGLVPFIQSRLTSCADPSVLYEYIAFGLRTVSVQIEAVEAMPGVRVYSNAESLTGLLRDALEFYPDEEFFKKCEEFLNTARWSQRGSALVRYLGKLC